MILIISHGTKKKVTNTKDLFLLFIAKKTAGDQPAKIMRGYRDHIFVLLKYIFITNIVLPGINITIHDKRLHLIRTSLS